MIGNNGKQPENQMTSSKERGGENCPGLSDLSRFMDGESSGAERRRIVRHLNRCRSCYSLFSEALRVNEALNEELIPERGGSGISQFFRTVLPSFVSRFSGSVRAGRIVMPALAVLLLVVMTLFRSHTPPDYQTLIASLPDSRISTQLNRQLSSVPYRSGVYGFIGDLALERAAFRIGVLAYNLEMTAWTGDTENSLTILVPLVSLLRRIDKKGSVTAEFQEAISRSRKGLSPSSLVGSTRKIEPLLREYKVSFFMLFGAWVQSGSLMAADEALSSYVRRDIRYFQKEVENRGLPPGIGKRLSSIHHVLNKHSLSEEDVLAIKKDFGTIIRILM